MFPLRFNDGRIVPRKWLGDAVKEVRAEFGAVSYETQKIEGHWQHAGITYREEHVRLFVDVPDMPKNRAWMKEFKARWKKRLKQLEIWMVSYRIEIE
jgi:hypothetical protein